MYLSSTQQHGLLVVDHNSMACNKGCSSFEFIFGLTTITCLVIMLCTQERFGVEFMYVDS